MFKPFNNDIDYINEKMNEYYDNNKESLSLDINLTTFCITNDIDEDFMLESDNNDIKEFIKWINMVEKATMKKAIIKKEKGNAPIYKLYNDKYGSQANTKDHRDTKNINITIGSNDINNDLDNEDLENEH